MNEANRENLSALSDGELEFDQVRFLLRRMEHDVHLRTTWTRYHMGRECLRHEFSGVASADFPERVMAALDNEAAADVRGSHGRRWLRWSAGGAIAASVAVAALMVMRPSQVPADAADNAHALATTTVARRQAADPVQQQARAPEVPRWLAASPAGQLTQPAAATTFDGRIQGDALIPAAYSRHMAPYMSLRGYPARTANTARTRARTPDGGWIIEPPAAANPVPPRLRAHQ